MAYKNDKQAVNSMASKKPAQALLDGPFLEPKGPWRQNLRLWMLLLPQYLMSIYLLGPEMVIPPSLAVVGGSLLACLLASPDRRRALTSLNWFINAWLVAIVSAGTSSPWPTDSLIKGLICGLITARFSQNNFMALPAAVPLASVFAAFILSRVKWLSPALQSWPLDFQWAVISWPELFILFVALIIYNRGRASWFSYALPWLSGLFALALAYFAAHYIRPPADPSEIPRLLARAAIMLPMALLIAPRLARSRLERLFYYVVFLLIWLLFPEPQMRSFIFGQDTAPFWAALFFIPWPLIKKYKAAPPNLKMEAEAGPFKAYIKCGHLGQAARPAQWLGPASCRLAADHDDGFLLCPYGCLGLGDCARACPAGAISLLNNFVYIDHNLCQGCGRCRQACPKNLLFITEDQVRAFIPCASSSSLKRNADYCQAACLGCSRCAKACPAGAIGRPGPFGAMEINQQTCLDYGPDCGRICAEVCPRQIIKAGHE